MSSNTDIADLKAKNKALRKYLIEETGKTHALQEEIDSMRIQMQERSETIENLQLTNQRHVK